MDNAEDEIAERSLRLRIAEADDAETRARWHLMASSTSTFGVALFTILLRISWIVVTLCTLWLIVSAFHLSLCQDWLEAARREAEKPRPKPLLAGSEAKVRKRSAAILSCRKWEAPLDEEARWRQNAKHGKFKAPGEEKEPPLR